MPLLYLLAAVITWAPVLPFKKCEEHHYALLCNRGKVTAMKTRPQSKSGHRQRLTQTHNMYQYQHSEDRPNQDKDKCNFVTKNYLGSKSLPPNAANLI
ncbi:hypothetical protein NQ317_006537 [Molorchus minor]|uniref:Secreted protein n=1 Tax=Molorchus minor TaxID=1323400 RepID=A0ABQ9J9A5_9CUCU|nr:hypothetical protein NQ317_006537 [Molorchus minor]